MTRRSVLSVILALIICIGIFPAASAENAALTDEQANAIAMLNYITVLTQDINASKNSRLYMEEAYSSLINNTYPNAVDSRTLSQLTGLLDTMEGYRSPTRQFRWRFSRRPMQSCPLITLNSLPKAPKRNGTII